MKRLIVIVAFALIFLTAGCAELKGVLWEQVERTFKLETERQFDQADLDGNGELSKDEALVLLDKILAGTKESLVGE